VVSVDRNGYLLAIRSKGLHLCVMELGIRPNFSDCSDYLLDYPEVWIIQDKTKRLSLENLGKLGLILNLDLIQNHSRFSKVTLCILQ